MTEPAAITVHSAPVVVPITAPPIRDGAVAVESGRILHVGERAWVVEQLRDRGVPFHETQWEGTLLPGLVNAHTHLQYTGMATLGRRQFSGFDDWSAAFDVDYEQPHDWAADAAAGAQQSLRSGVTSVADVVTDMEAATALADARLGGVAFWEVMDWDNASWLESGRSQILNELSRMPVAPGVGLSPHAPYSLDSVPLLELPDLVRNRGLRLHLHLGESALEGEHLPQLATADHDAWHSADLPSFRALRAHGFGASATAFVDRLGVLGPDCHVAHGVYLTYDDRALLRARRTTVALCPRSNATIGLDEPPVAAYLDEGSPIAVGTDSLSSSPSLDLLADVAALHRIARGQGYARRDLAARLLAAATLGGAHALGNDTGPRRVGHLAVGAQADLAVFDIVGSSVASTLVDLVENGAGTAIATIIAGEIRHTTADPTDPKAER